MSKIKVNNIEPVTGTNITIPTGFNLNVVDGINSSSLPTTPTNKGGTGLTTIGTSGQVLKVNSGATGLEYGDVTVPTNISQLSNDVGYTTVSAVNDLSDVDTSTTTPTDGQVLTWVNANSKWEPADASGGGITYDTTLQSSAFTAVEDTGYFVDVNSAAVTVTLPLTPTAGAKVAIIDVASNSVTNNITIARNGEKIAGTEDDMLVSNNGAGFTLIYSGSTYGWVLINK